MRNTWDQFAKEVIPTVLAGVGHVTTAVEAQADTQQVDVVMTPEPGVNWGEAFRTLGWIARMAERAAIIEPYSTTVGLDEVRDCLRKQLTLLHVWRKAAELKAKRQAEGQAEGQTEGQAAGQTEPSVPVAVDIPQLWLLSVGDARGASDAFGLIGRTDWPKGFRFAAPGFALCVVVLSDLPRIRETLALRLLGRGATLKAAIEDVRELAEDDPLRRPLLEVLAQRRFAALNSRNAEDLAEAEMFQQEWQKFKDQIRDEGRDAGREEGREEGLEEGIRGSILSLCRAFGVPVTAEREAQLKELSAEKLSAMLDVLATTRSWPTEH